MMMMVLNPNGTKSDSFYFADNELIIHKKAEYDYCTLMMQPEINQSRKQKEEEEEKYI